MRTLILTEAQVDCLDQCLTDAIQKHRMLQLKYVTQPTRHSEELVQYSEGCISEYLKLAEEISNQYDNQRKEE